MCPFKVSRAALLSTRITILAPPAQNIRGAAKRIGERDIA
jgi:hypothetical protein